MKQHVPVGGSGGPQVSVPQATFSPFQSPIHDSERVIVHVLSDAQQAPVGGAGQSEQV